MSDSDRWEEYRVLDVEKKTELADIVSLDVNGTELILKQRDNFPLMLEIYVENEEQPIGVINIAKGTTVCLGGVEEGLSKDLESVNAMLEEATETIEELRYRTNPEGKSPPDDGESTRP